MNLRLLVGVVCAASVAGCNCGGGEMPMDGGSAGGGNPTAGGGSTAGGGATAGGGNATAGGGNATAGGGNATAGGGNATAGGGNATAGGGNATAGGGNATAGGGNATAGGGNATAGGGNATAGGGNATAGGGNATAGGGNATAGGGMPSMVTGTIRIQAGDAYTNTTAVSLSLTASSTGGTVTQVRLANDGNPLGAPQAFANNLTWALDSTDGIRAVTVQFIDSTGATFSTFDTITLDRVAPFGSFIVQFGARYTNQLSVPLVLTYTDASNMVGATVRIGIDGGPLGQPVPYAAMLGATLPAVDGLHTLTLQVADAAGNLTMQSSQTITLDRELPFLWGMYLWGEFSDSTNNRNPPMWMLVDEDRELDAYCTVTTTGGVAAPAPPTNDPCWRPTGGIRQILSIVPQFPSDQQLNRVTVFVRDAAGNVATRQREITYDTTPLTGGVVVLTQGDAGYAEVSALASFGSLPPGVPAGDQRLQYGINPSNGSVADPNLFIWYHEFLTDGTQRRVVGEAQNGSLVSFAVRFTDSAGNGGQMSNVITNLRPRAAFEPVFMLPTAENLKRAYRIPLPNGSRFVVVGDYDNTFTSDDLGVTWVKRDALTHLREHGMAIGPAGQVLALNERFESPGTRELDVSADLGVYFRKVLVTQVAAFREPTFIAPRATGGSDFAMLDEAGRPYFVSLDARNALVELGSAKTPMPFTDVAGCVSGGFGGAIAIDGTHIFRSTHSGRTYQEVPLPAGFPATGTLSFVEASGGNVVIVAERSPGVTVLLRETACGAGPFVEVSGLVFVAGFRPVSLSVPGPDRAWVLTRSQVNNDVGISKVTFLSASTAGEDTGVANTTGRMNAITGDTGNNVVVVGDRGELWSGTYPGTLVQRRSRPIADLASLSVRDGAPTGAPLTNTPVVLGGTAGRVWWSNNSGTSWVLDPVAAATGPMVVDATNTAVGFISALEIPARLWNNPQTGWQSAWVVNPDAQPYRGISCYGPTCFGAGSFGAISRFHINGQMTTSLYEVPPDFQSPVDWYDIDKVELTNGPAWLAVGTNGTTTVTRLRAAGAMGWSPIVSSPAVGAGVGLKKVAIRRDGTGPVVAVATDGKVWTAPSLGAPFTTSLLLTTWNYRVLEHLSGNRFVVAGDEGYVYSFDASGGGTTYLKPPTRSNIVGVEVSDVDPNLVWVAAENGSVYMSRTGFRN
ncbi:MAG: Ig-like domain repeat protein [Myxococcaceae bacterium]|nr:Ig-like domain repeat protein [Myxococcaceae bacterium]